MKVKFTFILLVCVGLYSVKAQQEWTEEELAEQRILVEGQKQMILEDYDAAMDAFSKVYDKNPKQATALWGISRVHLEKKDYDLAEKSILKAIEVEPENKWFLEHYTKILKQDRAFEKLADTYKNLFELSPDQREYAFQASKYYERIKDYNAALNMLSGLDKKEVDPAVSYRRARIYDLSGSVKKSEKEYKKLVKSDPTEVRFLHLLAQHYQANRNNEKAVATYNEILKIDPNDTRASLAISNELRQSGGDVQYLESIEKIIVSPHIDVDTKVKELIPFVQKFAQTNDASLASILYTYSDTIAALHPNNPKTHALRGDVYNMSDNLEVSIPSYQKAVELDPSVYSVWEQFLYGLNEAQRFDELKKQSNEALDYFPNRGRIFYFLGRAHSQLYEYDEAINELKQASFMVGRDARLSYDIQSEMGQVLLRTKRYKNAIQAMEGALKINQNQAELLANYSAALYLGGEGELAKEWLEKATKIDEENPSVILSKAIQSIDNKDLEKSKSILLSNSTLENDPLWMEIMGDILFLDGNQDEAVKWWERAHVLTQEKSTELKIQKRQLHP